uniref:Small ubiquitin like modifier 3 n=1 Tax=Electrophorus electricus TaxID=8005 RepID=A0A4W4HCR4_ELEEL
MSEDKPKEGVKTENDHINLKVAGQDGSVVQFKIKRHTPLSKLMKAYCERQVCLGHAGEGCLSGAGGCLHKVCMFTRSNNVCAFFFLVGIVNKTD